jgi:hypothetical protein
MMWFLIAFVPIAALVLAWKPLPSGLSADLGFEAALGFTLGFGTLRSC